VDADRIRMQPLFAGLTDDEAAVVAGCADELVVDPGAKLTVEEEFGYSFFLGPSSAIVAPSCSTLAFFDQDFRRMESTMPGVAARIREAMADRFATKGSPATGS
jgi:hypothetical protein